MTLRPELPALLLLAGCHASQPSPAPTPTPTAQPTGLDALAQARRECPDLAAPLSADPEGDARKAFAAKDRLYRLIEIQAVAVSTHLMGVDKLEATPACPAPADRFRAILAGTDTRYCPNVESAADAYATRYNRELRKLCAGSPH